MLVRRSYIVSQCNTNVNKVFIECIDHFVFISFKVVLVYKCIWIVM